MTTLTEIKLGAPVPAQSFQGARLLEPIERRHHSEFITRKIVGKHFIAPPPVAYSCLSSTAPVYREQWFDDPNFANPDFDGVEHDGSPRYFVPPNHLVPLHKKVSLKGVEPPKDSDLIPDVPVYFSDTPRIKWISKPTFEPCYVPRVLRIELSSGNELWVPPPPTQERAAPPLPNAEPYAGTLVPFEELKKIRNVDKDGFSFGTEYFVCDSSFLIPSVRFKSAAKTIKGVDAFRERRDSAFLQRKMLYRAGEELLQQSVQQGKEEAEKQNTIYTGFENDYIDKRAYCKQCGASFFRRKKGKLRCYDCGWGLKEPKMADSEGSHIEGDLNKNKETHVTPARQRDLTAEFQMKYNPFDQKREDIEQQILNHPEFPKDVSTLEIRNTSPKEVAAQKGEKYDAFRQRTSRNRRELQTYYADFHTALRHEIVGKRKEPIPPGYNIPVELHGRIEVKYLGTLTDTSETYLKTLHRHQKTTIKGSLKKVRRQARQHGWSKKMLQVEEADTRAYIEAAYLPHFQRLEQEIAQGRGTVVTSFPIVEGRNA